MLAGNKEEERVAWRPLVARGSVKQEPVVGVRGHVALGASPCAINTGRMGLRSDARC